MANGLALYMRLETYAKPSRHSGLLPLLVFLMNRRGSGKNHVSG